MDSKWTIRKLVIVVVTILLLAVSPYIVFSLWEDLDAKEVMLIQAPLSGELRCFTDPGVQWQGFGKVTKYPRRATYYFDETKDKNSRSKLIQFNDGGHGNLYGAISWEMPLSCKDMIAVHKQFGSTEAIDVSAVGQMLDAAIYLAGPTMSSTESSGERRAELIQYINDQAENGVYVTRVVNKKIIDILTQQEKQAAVTEIVLDDQGQPKRRQGSILKEFNIRLLPMSVRLLDYDQIVKAQIAKRQEATTQVQIGAAETIKAEQEKRTAEAQGAANAARAKWEQETIKAKVVTEAQQRLDIASLDAKAAEQYKRQQILIGEGDGERRRLVMIADGALDKKIEAWSEAQAKWADAFARFGGQMVPSVVMGGGGSGASAVTSAQTLLELVAVKSARDLGLDMSMPAGRTTAAPAPTRK